MRKAHWIVPGIFFPLLIWAGPELGSSGLRVGLSPGMGDHIQLFSFQTHSRLSLRIDESVPVHWKALRKGFELTVKGLGLMDLGAPLGEEDKWRAQFEVVNDSRLDGLEISETPDGVKIVGKWKFPNGKLALANPEMEFFDFREQSPARYVVDFWTKPGPTITEVKATLHRRELLDSLKKAQEDEKKRIERKIASIKKHKQEVENAQRFCEEPLSEKNDAFLPFNPVHQNVDFSRWFPQTTADTEFSYFKPKKRNKEAQYVRLALEFYSHGNPGLTIRTLDFFDREFPRSDSQTEMKFLRANALLKLGFQEEGEQILTRLMQDAKDSPAALHAAIYLAGKLMARDLPLAASEKFFWLIRYYPNYGLSWVFHLGVAECLFALKQVEKAAKEYQWVVENGPDTAAKTEAAARQGDLYLSRFQYEQALGSYSQGSRYFPKQIKKFPEFFLNLGETLYQLGQYDRAKQVFSDFLESYPTHPGGWRAAFRLGEVFARRSKEGLSSEEARKWFYNAINHYPFSSGATLARIRLLPCGDHGGFNLAAQERFFSHEAKKFPSDPIATSEIFLKNYEDFRALARIRTIMALGSEEETASVAMEELHSVKNPVLKKTLAAAANEYFRKTILGLLNNGKSFEALSLYTAKAPLMPPVMAGNSPAPEYLLKLSRVASDYGLGRLAQELSKTYEQSLAPQSKAPNRSVASTDEEPAADTETQLKISERNFTQAKGLWTSIKDLAPNLAPNDSYPRIRELLDHVLDESPFSYEKELILGIMDDKEMKFQSALAHVSRAQLLNDNLRVMAWLAAIESKLGNKRAALDLYSSLEKRMISNGSLRPQANSVEENLGVPPVPSLEAVSLSQADIFEQRGRWGDAAATYSRAIDKGWGGSQASYQYARSLIKLGGISHTNKAREILEKLVNVKSNGESKGENEEFWKKLAFETLANMPRRGKNE